MTDKEQLMATLLGIRPGPKRLDRLNRRLRRLKRKYRTYDALRRYLAVEVGCPASREWLTQHIGTNPRLKQAEQGADAQKEPAA